jgi:hypothetical protein
MMPRGRPKGSKNTKKNDSNKAIVSEGTIEALPVQFEKKGVSFTQVKRTANALLYKLKNQDGHEYFEVFQRKTQKPFSLWSKGPNAQEYKYPAKEKYPNDEAFGIWAWTYNLPKLAMSKFEEISK